MSDIHSSIEPVPISSAPLVVLHSSPTWLPQTQIWMYNLVRFLPRDVESHILSETTENLDQFRLPNIHPLSEEPGWIYYRDYVFRLLNIRCHLGFLVDWATRVRANLLHSHFGNIGWTNMDAARQARVRHVVSYYGFDASYLPSKNAAWRARYRELFRRADMFLCEGLHMADCMAALGCPREKIRVHHLGVQTEEIAFRPRSWDPSTPLRVLIAASFQEKKGIPDAIEALGQLGKHTHLDVTIIGDANEEPRSRAEKRNILDAIDRNDLRQHTRLLGYRSHTALLEEAYDHHIFLSPSVTARDGDTEGGAPVTLIEMCATGMPIVSTRHCDIPEVVRDGITGLLAGERDIEGLADRMNWLISNPDRWFSMAKAGRKHIELNYDARTQGMRLGRLYRELHG